MTGQGNAEAGYLAFFQRYAQAYERALADATDLSTIQAFYADDLMALSTSGGTRTSQNDESFGQFLRSGFAFNASIGTVSMKAVAVEVSRLAKAHDRVEVSFEAGYRRKNGAELTIPFALTYLIQNLGDRPRIFAFIAGDETELYRRHGLIDSAGNPA